MSGSRDSERRWDKFRSMLCAVCGYNEMSHQHDRGHPFTPPAAPPPPIETPAKVGLSWDN